MNNGLFDDANIGYKSMNIETQDLYCVYCASKLSAGSFFCLNCDPPLPPGDEPEETGMSFKQAIIRIGIIFGLFFLVIIGKVDIPSDDALSIIKTKSKQEPHTATKEAQDKDFQSLNTVVVSLANIRSKPSKDGAVIVVVEEGTELTIIERGDSWSNVHAVGKKGWIYNELFRSEIVISE